MPSLLGFDRIHPMEGEGFAQGFTAQLQFLLISVEYRYRLRFG